MGRLGLFTPLRFSYWNYRSIEVSKSSFHLWKIFCRADDFSFYDATALEKVTRSYFFLLLLFFRCPINYRGMFSLKTTPIHTCNIKVINWNKTTSWSMKKGVRTYVIVLILFINTYILWKKDMVLLYSTGKEL